MTTYGAELEFELPADHHALADALDIQLEQFSTANGYYSIDSVTGDGKLSILIGINVPDDAEDDHLHFHQKLQDVISALEAAGIDTTTLAVVQTQSEFVFA